MDVNIATGMEVKVRMDAYTGEAGLAHNGRPGRVIAVVDGDVLVMYLDRPGVFVRHPPAKLFVYARR